MKRIITFSREFASGGRTIAKLVSEELGIGFYDSEIVKKVATESGYAADFIESRGEYADARSSFVFSLMHNVNFIPTETLTVADRIYILQSNFIKELANNEECVIVGRCADYILRDRDDCLNVFVYSTIEERMKRAKEIYHEEKWSERYLLDRNDRRKTYYKYYTGRDWGSYNLYDLCLNSATLGLEGCVKVITELYNQE